jgi:hypothetical protein
MVQIARAAAQAMRGEVTPERFRMVPQQKKAVAA